MEKSRLRVGMAKVVATPPVGTAEAGKMRVRRHADLICIMLTALVAPASAAEYFVGKHGADANDGLSREAASTTMSRWSR